MFLIAGSVYVLAVLVIHALVPRLAPVVLGGGARATPMTPGEHAGTVDSLRDEVDARRYGAVPGLVRVVLFAVPGLPARHPH